MSKVYQCDKCGVQFTRGRGRPPVRPLCPAHTHVNGAAKVAVVKATLVPEKSPTPTHEPDSPPETWGGGSTAITRPCPNCGYAYADGGYCPECGWSLPVNRVPYGTATGRKFKRG